MRRRISVLRRPPVRAPPTRRRCLRPTEHDWKGARWTRVPVRASECPRAHTFGERIPAEFDMP